MKSINKEIKIIGYFEKGDSGFNLKEKKYNIHVKSLLQKSIRRGNKKAVKSAFHLVKMDILIFLRRILIMIEDVIIHESTM